MTRNRKRPEYAEFGTVSEGTLRDSDLVDAFATELERLYRDTGRRMPPHVRTMLEDIAKLDEVDFEDGDAGDYVEELEQELEHFAPPFGYFGTLEGDGAHFGFWLSHDALREAIASGIMMVQDDRVDGGRWDDIPRRYNGFVLRESDHGNLTLLEYRNGKPRVVWSIV